MTTVKSYKRIVVKVGSSVLTEGKTHLVQSNVERIVGHIVNLCSSGKEAALVTSGAIACGLSAMGLDKRPSKLAQLQAAAAVGQNILMQTYTAEFAKHHMKCAQVLLTREDFHQRHRYLNIKNTLNSLLSLKIVPIINENDTVSSEEIKFGDNDMLSALVAMLIEADGLEILSDIEGLCRTYNKEKKTYGDLIKKVKQVTSEIEIIAGGTTKASCIGGMESKIEAIKIAANVGIPVVLANGRSQNLKIDFSDPDHSDGTFFEPAAAVTTSKNYWIAFGAQTKGALVVDDGAKKALVTRNASLLFPGITEVRGDFTEKNVVEVIDKDNIVIGRGITGYSSHQLRSLRGKRAEKEVLHRDNLVILA